jgi:hypothetical protein
VPCLFRFKIHERIIVAAVQYAGVEDLCLFIGDRDTRTLTLELLSDTLNDFAVPLLIVVCLCFLNAVV